MFRKATDDAMEKAKTEDDADAKVQCSSLYGITSRWKSMAVYPPAGRYSYVQHDLKSPTYLACAYMPNARKFGQSQASVNKCSVLPSTKAKQSRIYVTAVMVAGQLDVETDVEDTLTPFNTARKLQKFYTLFPKFTMLLRCPILPQAISRRRYEVEGRTLIRQKSTWRSRRCLLPASRRRSGRGRKDDPQAFPFPNHNEIPQQVDEEKFCRYSDGSTIVTTAHETIGMFGNKEETLKFFTFKGIYIHSNYTSLIFPRDYDENWGKLWHSNVT